MIGENWLRALDLASIATWLMIIGFAILLFISKSSRKSTKK